MKELIFLFDLLKIGSVVTAIIGVILIVISKDNTDNEYAGAQLIVASIIIFIVSILLTLGLK